LMLRQPALTLAAAESMTCGRVQAAVGTISGASNFFLGGITAYSLEGKVRQLGVERAAAKKVNGVSAEVAEQMARGACELFGSDERQRIDRRLAGARRYEEFTSACSGKTRSPRRSGPRRRKGGAARGRRRWWSRS